MYRQASMNPGVMAAANRSVTGPSSIGPKTASMMLVGIRIPSIVTEAPTIPTLSQANDYFFSRIMSAAFSPIMIDGAFVFPDTISGMIDASATHKPSIPCTRKR